MRGRQEDGGRLAEAKKRLDPTPSTLRSLYIASGGICEMQDCNKRLTQPTGAWIGTVAHIVSAEDNGPRADKKMLPEERRKASNLMLLCADHGREVDDRETGEKLYPRMRLEEIKRSHESRFTGLIDEMMSSSRSRARSAADFIDTTTAVSVAGQTASGFIDYWALADGGSELTNQARGELDESRRVLTQLSQAALTMLSWMLGVWESSLEPDAKGETDFGVDWIHPESPAVHESLIHNRELNQEQLHSALIELEMRRIVHPPSPEASDYQERKFYLSSPWTKELTSWCRIAEYLDRRHQTAVSEWLKALDFSVFDALAATASVWRLSLPVVSQSSWLNSGRALSLCQIISDGTNGFGL
jgi:hypothetical protein